MYRSGAPADVGPMVAVKDRQNAMKNPYAHLKLADISIESVKASPMMWDPVRYLESCPSSDGACAVIFTDEDHSAASRRLLKGLEAEGSLIIMTRPATKKSVEQPEYTAATAEAAVRDGAAPVALVVPAGFGANPISFGRGDNHVTVQLLRDSSDMIAPQVITGLLQKIAMTSMPDLMAAEGSKYMDQYLGGFTPEQREKMNAGLERFRRQQESGQDAKSTTLGSGEILPVNTRDVVGANKDNPMVSFYAAAIGVMFLLFTASGAAGSLLEEVENGTLDRVLSSRVSMTILLAGKLS